MFRIRPLLQLNTKTWYKSLSCIVLLCCLCISFKLYASQSYTTPLILSKHDVSTDDVLLKIFQHTQEQDLAHAKHVSWYWKQVSEHNSFLRLFNEKRKLYELMLEVTETEVNEVQHARDQLTLFLEK